MANLQVGIAETTTGPIKVYATAGDLATWSPVNGGWSLVTLQVRYAPIPHPQLPSRGANKAGETAAFPAPEANALIAAGYATSASGSATQTGVGVN